MTESAYKPLPGQLSFLAPPVVKDRETKVMRSVIIRLRRLGLVLYRRNVGGFKKGDHYVRFGSAGQSDLYGWEIATGRHWEIETKRYGEVPSRAQLAWLRQSGKLGAVAYWGDSANAIEWVATHVLEGGKVVWLGDGPDFDVEMP